MDTLHKVLAVALAVALAIAGLAVYEGVQAHVARMVAETQAKALVDQANAIDAHDKQLTAQFQQQIAQLQIAAAQQKTPEQITKWLPTQVATPQPITIQLPPGTKDNPTPPAIATIPQEDLQTLRDFVTVCKVDAVKVPELTQELADSNAKLKLVQQDAANWKKASKGTVWSRTKTALKWIGVGAAIGAIAVVAR